MQSGGEGRDDFLDLGERFGNSRGFGSFRSGMPSIFGGRDPFDDPFFTRPFGSMFGSSVFGSSGSFNNASVSNESKGIVIEELNSDDEGGNGKEEENEGIKDDKGTNIKHSGPRSSTVPSIEHVDDDDADDDERKSKSVSHWNDHNKVKASETLGTSFSVCKVTYGGVDGAYYTSTRTRKTGNDGVVLEENKEADRTTGHATHRISRGIHDKGHSVTRNLNSKGEVNTLQTLHNLNEDEVAGFEEAWKVNAKGHLPHHGVYEDSNMGRKDGRQKGKATSGGWTLTHLEQAQQAGGSAPNDEARTNPSKARTKKVVRINIE